MEDMATLITTVGFPAAMCIIICVFCYKMWEAYRIDIATMRDVIAECSKAVENNTEMIKELLHRERGVDIE